MGCAVDLEGYNAPMPWIGLYITAASVACSIAMFVDIILGWKRKRLWIPCKWFSLNATSLTLLAIATKLPVDLSTPMPTAQEQFAKLSGTSLLCIAMSHFMPSIGAMEDSQVILNVVPLVILVVTVIVNICTQIGTGVIHAFVPEHIVTLCFMLVILLISCSSALAIPTMKGLLKQQLELHCHEMQHIRQPNEPVLSTVESLRTDIKKYLTMALTSNPQHVLSRSCLGIAAGRLCVIQAAVLIEALIRMLKGVAVSVCTNHSTSAYKWSISFIAFSQAFTVVVGTFGPFLRSRYESRNSSSTGTRESQGHQGHQSSEREGQSVGRRQNKLGLERYWTQKFFEWKDSPLFVFHTRNRCFQRLIYDSKNLFFEVMRWIHIGVVSLSKVVDLNIAYYNTEDVLAMERMMLQNIRKMREMLERKILQATRMAFPRVASSSSMYEELRTERARQAAEKIELRPFVLHLENEGRLVDQIMCSYDLDVDGKIQKGSSEPITNLTKLLMKASEHHPGLARRPQSNTTNHVQEYSNFWALPLVTLTSIALALPCPQGDQIKTLLRDGVSEGLKYVRYVDKSLNPQGQLAKVREAADVVWQGVDLYNRWLDMDLAAFATERRGPRNIIEQLVIKGSSYKAEVESLACVRGDLESGTLWPPRALALCSMANICKFILDTHSSFNANNATDLFGQLHLVISDMLGACLVELPRALYVYCYNSCLESEEERVMEAAYLLGGAENIFKIISKDGMVVNQSKYFEHWRSFMSSWSDRPCISTHDESNPVV